MNPGMKKERVCPDNQVTREGRGMSHSLDAKK